MSQVLQRIRLQCSYFGRTSRYKSTRKTKQQSDASTAQTDPQDLGQTLDQQKEEEFFPPKTATPLTPGLELEKDEFGPHSSCLTNAGDLSKLWFLSQAFDITAAVLTAEEENVKNTNIDTKPIKQEPMNSA